MTTPRILVLMATFNGRAWLEEQVTSILTQQGVEVTLLVSDDGSTDGTRELLHQLAQQHANVGLLEFPARSGSAAANFTRLLLGADIGSYDYVALADQDDLWQPDKLARAAHCLATEGFDGYSSNVDALFADGRRKALDKASPQVAFDHYFESPGPGCSFVLGRRLLTALLPALAALTARHERLFAYHDWFIYAFARHAGFRWHIDPASTLLYRQHAHNVVGANVGMVSGLRRVQRMRDGWYLDEIRWQLQVLQELQPASEPTGRMLSMAQLRMHGLLDRWRFVRDVAPHARRRWQDRLWLSACVLTGIVR